MALWLYRIGFLAATEAPKFICCSQVSLFFSENPTNPCESAAEVVTEGLRCRLCGVLPDASRLPVAQLAAAEHHSP